MEQKTASYSERHDQLEAECLQIITETDFEHVDICDRDLWFQAFSGDHYRMTTIYKNGTSAVVGAEDFTRDITLDELSLYELCQITDQILEEYGK